MRLLSGSLARRRDRYVEFASRPKARNKLLKDFLDWLSKRGKRPSSDDWGKDHARVLDRLSEDVLDLAVHTAQLVSRPGLEVGPEPRVDPQQELFAPGHHSVASCRACPY